MSLITANKLPVSAADFVMPISRAWHVDMSVSTANSSAVSGKISININDGALVLSGTANVEGIYLDSARIRVVAGAGGLGKAASPKSYQSPSVKIVLSDLLSTAGEKLSSTADPGTLSKHLDAWTVSEMTVADAIGLLMKKAGAAWRMLPDGTFWCGSESWPESKMSYSLEQEDKAHAQIVISSEAPLLLPGQSLGGKKISYVEHHVDDKTVRTTAWIVTPNSGDRMRDSVVAMTRSAVPQIDYFALYRAKVVAQAGSNFDLIPDDPRLPSSGFKSIPIHWGIPGYSAQVVPGATVLLGWHNGDQSSPYCCLWGGGETVTTATLAALAILLGGDSAADFLIKGTTFGSSVITSIAAAGVALSNMATDPIYFALCSTAANFSTAAGAALSAAAAAFPSTLSTVSRTL